MILNIVCDISGSMSEGGKLFAMRTAVMTVAQWTRFGYGHAELKLYGTGSESRLFSDWNARDEFPAVLLDCSGSSFGETLIGLFEKGSDDKVLLLTDGFWTREGARMMKRWKELLGPNTLRIIKIGADSNPQIKGPDVFAAEDLFAALDSWLAGGST